MEIEQLIGSDGLMVREFAVRASDAGTREFTGIGVPYDETYEAWFGNERFDRGSVDGSEAKIYWQHREVIGKVIASTDTEAGHQVTGRISDTTQGREAYTLLKDGVIDRMSIGFIPKEYRVEVAADGTETIVHTRVEAKEFSLVSFPAYSGAKVSEVRHTVPATPKGTTMGNTDTLTRADLSPLEDQLRELARSNDVIRAEMGQQNAAPILEQWRSMGDFLKALASGDEAAAEAHRAYTGATTADTVMKDTFVGDFIKLVADRRPVKSTFTEGTLPASGLSVDYTQLKSDTTKAAEQVNQGDDLVNGKVQLEDKNAPVKTYGGWTELSRQLIERASVASLNTTLRALALEYAKVTNAVVKTKYLDTVAANIALANDAAPDAIKPALKISAAATTDEWLDLIVDAAEIYEENGFTIAGLHVSTDIFKKLIRLKDGTDRLMTVYGAGVNQVGELNLRQVSGSLANIRVDLLPGAAGFASFYDPVAIETLESAGAPAQLQDENTVNLTKSFSLYGYQAVLVPFPQAIVPVEQTA